MKQFYNFEIDKIKNLSTEDKNKRKKNLDLFNKIGFPNKKDEDWKFTDLNSILSKNFTNIVNKELSNVEKKLNFIGEFEHNYISLFNGKLVSNNFSYEEEEKISLKNYNFKDEINLDKKNSLNFLNNALAIGGYSLEVFKNYKFRKPLVVYNNFSESLKETIVNYKNSIILNENSDLVFINYINNFSKENFMVNTMDIIKILKNSSLKNVSINNSRCNGYFYKDECLGKYFLHLRN